MPAGGSFSTAGDLLAFANALLQHELLSAADTNLVIAGKVATGPPFPAGEKYGYGFEDYTYSGTRIVGHGGGAPGAVTRVTCFSTRDIRLWSWETAMMTLLKCHPEGTRFDHCK